MGRNIHRSNTAKKRLELMKRQGFGPFYHPIPPKKKNRPGAPDTETINPKEGGNN